MRFHHRKLTENQLSYTSFELNELSTRITKIANNNSEYAKNLDDVLKHLRAAQEIIVDLGLEHDIYLNEVN